MKENNIMSEEAWKEIEEYWEKLYRSDYMINNKFDEKSKMKKVK